MLLVLLYMMGGGWSSCELVGQLLSHVRIRTKPQTVFPIGLPLCFIHPRASHGWRSNIPSGPSGKDTKQGVMPSVEPYVLRLLLYLVWFEYHNNVRCGFSTFSFWFLSWGTSIYSPPPHSHLSSTTKHARLDPPSLNAAPPFSPSALKSLALPIDLTPPPNSIVGLACE